MNCETMLELMSAALDGELTAEEKAELDRHLAQCDQCRALFNDLRVIHASCDTLEAVPPPILKESILKNLPPQEPPALKQANKVIPIRWKRWAAMAAAFVLVSLAAWHLPKTDSQLPRDTVEPLIALPRETESVPSTGAAGDFAVPAATPLPDITNNDKMGTSAEEPDLSDSGQASDVSGVSDAAAPKSVLRNAPAVSSEGQGADAGFSGASDQSDGNGTESAVTSYEITAQKIAIAPDASENNTASSPILFSSARAAMASVPPNISFDEASHPEIGGGAGGGGGASFEMRNVTADGFDEIPAPHPEMAEGENAVAYFETQCPPSSLGSHCGVLTFNGSVSLIDYQPAMVLDGVVAYYELPKAAFDALVKELETNNITFDLCTTGDTISATAETGLVCITL